MIASDSTVGRDESDFALQWELWHRDHENRRASPHGFLAITGLHWLNDVPTRFDDVPGAWSSGPDGVDFRLGDGETLIVADQRVIGHFRFGDGDEHGTIARFGDAIGEVAEPDCRSSRDSAQID